MYLSYRALIVAGSITAACSWSARTVAWSGPYIASTSEKTRSAAADVHDSPNAKGVATAKPTS